MHNKTACACFGIFYEFHVMNYLKKAFRRIIDLTRKIPFEMLVRKLSQMRIAVSTNISVHDLWYAFLRVWRAIEFYFDMKGKKITIQLKNVNAQFALYLVVNLRIHAH